MTVLVYDCPGICLSWYMTILIFDYLGIRLSWYLTILIYDCHRGALLMGRVTIPLVTQCFILLLMGVFQQENQSQLPSTYTPYMTVYLVNFLPKVPYTHRMYMVLANPIQYICTVCERVYGNFPAKFLVYTPYRRVLCGFGQLFTNSHPHQQ
jgi:hypothetical protein